MSSDTTRRGLLQQIAAAALAGSLSAEAADHVHQATAQQSGNGVYHPRALTEHEFATLRALCELIVPGASKGRAAEFIDLLSSQNPELAAIYTGGLAWLDHAMKNAVDATFLDARLADQAALLDKIAYRHNPAPDLAPGIQFFEWARRMTVDAYYTSAAGIQEIGYLGNKGAAEFKVPQASLDYALKRSGLA
jgi:gluconate 2-dehydrogenase gamma chain